MNTARDRRNLALELSERTTDDLLRIMTARKPDRPDRFVHPVALRRVARHVIMARAITETAQVFPWSWERRELTPTELREQFGPPAEGSGPS